MDLLRRLGFNYQICVFCFTFSCPAPSWLYQYLSRKLMLLNCWIFGISMVVGWRVERIC